MSDQKNTQQSNSKPSPKIITGAKGSAVTPRVTRGAAERSSHEAPKPPIKK